MEPKWTQDQAIAFESARECITDLMGICSARLSAEEKEASPDPDRLAAIETEMCALWRERAELRLTDDERVAFICKEYGARVRAHRGQPRREVA